jgi:hypothetical protein
MTRITRETTIVHVPEGCEFYSLAAFAESWVAYDALTTEAGWTEHEVGFKTLGEWPGVHICVHQPDDPRPEATR